jgi:hypothetical protein
MRRTFRKLAISSGICVVALAALELWFRSEVPASGITPFRTSSVEGLACELRPGFRTLYKGHEISINSFGFRGAEPGPRRPGVLRVALVGDSFTFGTGVGDRETIAAKLVEALEKSGREAEVFNFGVPGYTAANVAATAVHKALPLDLDALVYVFYANDVDAPPAFGPIAPDTTIDSFHGFPARSALLQWTAVRVKQLALAFDVQLGKRTQEFSRDEYLGPGGERVRAALKRIDEACDREQVVTLFACYPFLTRRGFNPFRPIDELALADAKALGIAATDLLDAFEGEEDLSGYWVSPFDQHPDGRANAKVASVLAAVLARLAPP